MMAAGRPAIRARHPLDPNSMQQNDDAPHSSFDFRYGSGPRPGSRPENRRRHMIEIQLTYRSGRGEGYSGLRHRGTDRNNATLSRPVHIRRASRHARLPGRAAARFPAPPRRRHHLPRRRHRRRLAAARGLVLAAGAQRRGAEAAAQGAQGHPPRSTSRATTTSSCAITSARISAASRWSTQAMHVAADGRRYLVIARRQFRSRGAARALACLARRPAPIGSRSCLNTAFNGVRRRLGLPLLVAVAMGKLKVKNAVNYIGEFETRSPPRPHASARRRDLRPHPSRRDPRLRRRPLHQLRRLGRELQRGGRASRRPVRDRLLGSCDAAGRRRCPTQEIAGGAGAA